MKLKGRLLDLHLDYVTHRPKLVIELQGQDNLGEYGKLKEEKILDIDITKPSAKRSLNANAYLHLLLNKLARHYDVADDEIKIKMNLQYGTIATDDNGKVIGMVSIGDLTDSEMSDELIGEVVTNVSK